MRITQQTLKRIVDKQGDVLRLNDRILHFMCESISKELVGEEERNKMLNTIHNTPDYKALLTDLLKKSVPDRERHAFIAFTTELNERVVTYQIPIGDVPFGYVDNKLMFATVHEAVHWLTSTSQQLILENSQKIQDMVKYLGQLIKRDETGVVMGFVVTYVDGYINLAFAVRSVME